jgi:hypothetical protein
MAVLVSLLMAISLLAWSLEEVHKSNKDENPGEGIRVGGGGPIPGGRAGEAVPVARTGGRLVVERAMLSSAGNTDLIQARVEYGGSWVWPRCSLLEGPDVEVVRGIVDSQEPPRAQGFTRRLWEESLWDEHESLWADRSTIEKSLLDGGAVLWTFREDLETEDKVADPRRTPFFVRCAGGDPPDVVHDVARVLGTPS